MADVAISNLTNQIEEAAAGDLLAIDDISAAETKKIPFESLLGGNALINQDFSIWQENTTFTNPGNLVYNADGYYGEVSAGGGTLPTINVKKNTSAQEAAYDQCCELEITNVGSGFDFWRISQKIEDYKKYRGKQVTVTYRLKASAAITFAGGVWVYDGITYSPTTVNSLNTSWQTFTDTITVGAANTELRAGFHIGPTISATCSIYIQFVKMEIGAVASPLTPRQKGSELALCQRYYQKSYLQGVFPGAVTEIGSEVILMDGLASSNHNIYLNAKFPIIMKAAPTITLYDAAGNSGKVTMAAGNNIAGAANNLSDSGFRVQATNGAVSTTRKLLFHYVAVSRP